MSLDRKDRSRCRSSERNRMTRVWECPQIKQGIYVSGRRRDRRACGTATRWLPPWYNLSQ